MFKWDITEHVYFQQRVPLDICFENRNLSKLFFLMQNIAKKKKKDFSGSKFEVSCQHSPNNLRFKKAQQLKDESIILLFIGGF
jgi:hypothetical protein